jgi:glycosyltransferase involved in cell wall biosynthesis
MKILCLSRSLPRHGVGGMQRVAWDLATGLADRGHQVKIMTTATADGKDTVVPAALSERLAVEHLPGTRPAQYSRSWWRQSRVAYLRAQKEGARYDVVLSVSAGAWSIFPVLGTMPVIMQAHGTSITEIQSKLRSGRPVAFLRALHNLWWVPWDLGMYRRSRKVVAVGPKAYAALRHPLIQSVLPPDKLVMIANGIDTERYRPCAEARAALARRLAIPEGGKVLVWASRLHRQKGTHLALSAFAEVPASELSFVIIGDGPERRSLENQAQALGIARRVRFVGQIDNDEMPHWLSVGDAFVFTSIREEVGFTLTILEAMSMNLPLVASKHLVESLKDVEGVYAVDPIDIGAVSRAMQRAVLAPSRGRDVVERHYSRHIMIQRYEDLFESLVAT